MRLITFLRGKVIAMHLDGGSDEITSVASPAGYGYGRFSSW